MTAASLFIGTYTDGPQGRGSGIYHCEVDLHAGTFGTVDLAVAARNPSYLINGFGSFIYATQEHDDLTEAGVIALRRDGRNLKLFDETLLSGAGACHLAISPDCRFLAVAQYDSGTTDLLSLWSSGSIGPRLSTVHGEGSGPNALRQEGPHAHCVAFLDSPVELAIVDLGSDRITVVPLELRTSVLDLSKSRHIEMPAGSGPRHLDVTPDDQCIVVLCELDETILFYERTQVDWHLTNTLSAFERPIGGQGAAAALRRDASGRLYASSRTDDLIACIAPGDSTTVRQRIASGGTHPRDIALAPGGHIIVAANQFDDRLTSFCVEPTSGTLTPTGHVAIVPSPACLLFPHPQNRE